MPIVELDIGGTKRRVQVDEGFKPEDLDYIAQQHLGDGGGVMEGVKRGAEYAGGKGLEFMGALGRLTGLPGRPEATPGEVASDVLTVAGPVAAPYLTAAGTGV